MPVPKKDRSRGSDLFFSYIFVDAEMGQCSAQIKKECPKGSVGAGEDLLFQNASHKNNTSPIDSSDSCLDTQPLKLLLFMFYPGTQSMSLFKLHTSLHHPLSSRPTAHAHTLSHSLSLSFELAECRSFLCTSTNIFSSFSPFKDFFYFSSLVALLHFCLPLFLSINRLEYIQ